jgi:hypothetical protein
MNWGSESEIAGAKRNGPHRCGPYLKAWLPDLGSNQGPAGNSPLVELAATLGAEPIYAYSAWSIQPHVRRRVALTVRASPDNRPSQQPDRKFQIATARGRPSSARCSNASPPNSVRWRQKFVSEFVGRFLDSSAIFGLCRNPIDGRCVRRLNPAALLSPAYPPRSRSI